MKLIDLAAQINLIINESPENADLIVSIPNKITGALCSPTVSVKYGIRGIDWTNGKFLIIPQTDMIAKENIPQELSIKKILKKVPQTNKTRHMKIADIKKGRK